MFSPQLLDHFEHPRNTGDLPQATVRVVVENPACGDVLELALQLEGKRIAQVRFRAKGCVPAIACASAITGLLAGRSLDEAAAVTKQDVEREVGGVPSASGHALQLAVDATRAAVEKLKADPSAHA